MKELIIRFASIFYMKGLVKTWQKKKKFRFLLPLKKNGEDVLPVMQSAQKKLLQCREVRKDSFILLLIRLKE